MGWMNYERILSDNDFQETLKRNKAFWERARKEIAEDLRQSSLDNKEYWEQLRKTLAARYEEFPQKKVGEMGELDNTYFLESVRNKRKIVTPERTVDPPVRPAELTFEELKKQVFFDLATSPSAVIPAVAGLTGLLAGFALSIPLLVLGSVGVIGVGIMIAIQKLTNFSTHLDNSLKKMKEAWKKYHMDRLSLIMLVMQSLKKTAVLEGFVTEIAEYIERMRSAYDKFTTQVYEGRIKGNADDLVKGAGEVADQVVNFVDKFIKIKTGKGSNDARRALADEIKDAVERFEALVKSDIEELEVNVGFLDRKLSVLEENIEVHRRAEERLKEMGVLDFEKREE